MNEKTYNKHLGLLMAQQMKKHETLFKLCDDLVKEIENHRYNFKRAEQELKCLKSIKRHEVLNFINVKLIFNKFWKH